MRGEVQVANAMCVTYCVWLLMRVCVQVSTRGVLRGVLRGARVCARWLPPLCLGGLRGICGCERDMRALRSGYTWYTSAWSARNAWYERAFAMWGWMKST